MEGPFKLIDKNINKVKRQPGVYILGDKKSDKKYVGYYVGRSDDNIAERLAYWFYLIQAEEESKNDSEKCIINKSPKLYWMDYTNSAKQAYEKECKIYHEKEKEYVCNKIHPAKTYNAWVCPVCKK